MLKSILAAALVCLISSLGFGQEKMAANFLL